MPLDFSVKLAITHGSPPVTLESEISGATLGNNKIRITDPNILGILGNNVPGYVFTPSLNVNYGGVSVVSTPGPRFFPVKGTPTITFNPIGKAFGASAFQLSPISNSLGTFTFTTSDSKVATVNGSTVTIIDSGTVTITAIQSATEEHNARTVTTTLTVTEPVISYKNTINTDPSTFGSFNRIFGIAVDRFNRIYASDTFNNRVLVFNSDRTYIKTIGTGGGGGNTQLNLPGGIAFDTQDRIYIADIDNHCIKVFSYDGTNGTFLKTIGNGRGSGNGQLQNPYGVAVDTMGNICVADFGNNRLQIFSYDGTNGTFIKSIGLSNPSGVAVDKTSGKIYVASLANELHVYNSNFIYNESFGRQGDGPGQFKAPYSLTINAGRIYVADLQGNRVQILKMNGTYVGQIGTGSAGSGNNQLNWPYGVAVNSEGIIYIADSTNNRIQIWGPQ